ncbi:MltA domain-containing protein [Polycladidibacter hongkongensis]|uniref:MltA domain-containing protein n=1 Tax=Polycladidibacter hongkongensis TaxID=1647556 RepID=UPI000834E8E9|nr:MltA domain-containing protein [Pseudovibrio hongkongensis]
MPLSSPFPELIPEPVELAALPMWQREDHIEALRFLLKNAESGSEPLGAPFLAAAHAALAEGAAAAQRFLEQSFIAYQVKESGFVTGYYQPVVKASLSPCAEFSVPLYRPPANPDDLPDRAAVMAGALEGQGLELCYLKSAVDAFFIAIQGSATLQLRDGRFAQLRFAKKSGHPYTPIGRLLIERGEIAAEDMSMDALRAWLAAHLEEQDALFAQNRSYIFFRLDLEGEAAPIGAAEVPLIAERSLAIDPRYHPYGRMLYVAAAAAPPDAAATTTDFARIMRAQDTGSAIKGAARGDIFFGIGESAGQRAGCMQNEATFFILAQRDDA